MDTEQIANGYWLFLAILFLVGLWLLPGWWGVAFAVAMLVALPLWDKLCDRILRS